MKITTIPQVYRNVNRWREILSILSKYGLANWISRFDLTFAKGLLKNRDGEVLARHTRETRIRLAIEELGPVFIKLGQILSTRPDLVGATLAEQLKILQTDVPADSAEVVRATIENELGQSVERLFVDFDATPMASASIGQVHRARLSSGAEVAVKVQHHDIRDRVRVDMDILAGLAQLAERIPELVNYRPSSTVAEFQRALRRELDFTREARNLEEIAHNFAGRPEVHIPRVDAKLSTSRVLTMEFLRGAKVADAGLLERPPFDADRVARRCADIYLQMIFQDGFYHADPHPGNLVIMTDDVVGLLDFGMVGRLDEPLREDIEEMLLAIVGQDAEQLTLMLTRVGAVPPSLDESNLRIDVADFIGHYAHLPLDKLDLGSALSEMVELIRRYHVMLPAPIALLLKALIMLEGTARLLNPQFSLMEAMEPYQRRMMLRRLSPIRHLKKIRRISYEFEQLAELLPRRIREILQQVQSGKFDVHLDHRGLEPSVNRLVLGMLASALFLGSSLLMSRNVWPLYGVSVPGVLGGTLSLLLGIRLLWAISKSGHLDRRQ
jgi:ubiquinone biosynthesis protein